MAVQPRGWAKVIDAARYAGVAPRTFRKWFAEGLRYVKAPTGALLVKLDWIDEFLEKFEIDQNGNDVNQIVEEVMHGLL